MPQVPHLFPLLYSCTSIIWHQTVLFYYLIFSLLYFLLLLYFFIFSFVLIYALFFNTGFCLCLRCCLHAQCCILLFYINFMIRCLFVHLFMVFVNFYVKVVIIIYCFIVNFNSIIFMPICIYFSILMKCNL